MKIKTYDPDITNKLIARMIWEICYGSNIWVTGQAIDRQLLNDKEGKKQIKLTISKLKRRGGRSFESSDIPPMYRGHFSEMFKRGGWSKYFERRGIPTQYEYKPRSNMFRKLREKFPKRVKTSKAVDLAEPSKAKRIKSEVERIVRDTSMTRKIKLRHKYRCQICGHRLKMRGIGLYAEAHHIRPLGKPHDGNDVEENIICVCPNHHALLDYKAIKLNFNKLRKVQGHVIARKYIDYHNALVDAF